MPNNYVQVSSISHDYNTYSPENIARELDLLNQNGVPSEVIEKYKSFLDGYPEEFSVLYRISAQSLNDEMSPRYELAEVPYRRPEIACEEYDASGKTKQLELQCTLNDGTKFGFSALKTSTEPQQMQGQISFSDQTLRDLNDEKLKQIFEFCHKYGFSTFGLSLPMNGGMIDVDAKLKELFERYQEQELKNIEEHPGAGKLSENEENSDSEAILNDYVTLMDDVPHISAPKKEVTLDDEVENIENLLRKDLHKKEDRSYWKNKVRFRGGVTYVFSIYDKENPDNYHNDGQPDPKNPKVHIPTYAYRLYVSYYDNHFRFGYATPGGKPFDSTMAGDFIGEIKKTGITHLNLVGVPNCDKVTLMIACSEKGIVPKGVKITRDKAEKMLAAAKAKLSKEELSAFEFRLMEQWEANVAAKGEKLSIHDQGFIQRCKNESHDLLTQQASELSAASLNKDFINFKTAYSDELKAMVEQKIEEGSRDSERGAAITMGAMQTLRSTFDLYFGDENAPNLGETIGSRIENRYTQLETELQKRLEDLAKREQKISDLMTNADENKKMAYEADMKELQEKKHQAQEQMDDLKAEKSALVHKIDVLKPVRALTTEDITTIYKVLYPLQEKRMEQRIIKAFREDDAARVHRADDVLIGGVIFPTVKGSVAHINTVLFNNNLDKLELPLEHAGLLYERPRDLRWSEVQRREEKEKAARQAQAERAAQAAEAKSRGY